MFACGSGRINPKPLLVSNHLTIPVNLPEAGPVPKNLADVGLVLKSDLNIVIAMGNLILRNGSAIPEFFQFESISRSKAFH